MTANNDKGTSPTKEGNKEPDYRYQCLYGKSEATCDAFIANAGCMAAFCLFGFDGSDEEDF